MPLPAASERARELGASLTSELDPWFATALSLHPKARFSSIAEMAKAFAAISGGAQAPSPAATTGSVSMKRTALGLGAPALAAAAPPRPATAPTPVATASTLRVGSQTPPVGTPPAVRPDPARVERRFHAWDRVQSLPEPSCRLRPLIFRRFRVRRPRRRSKRRASTPCSASARRPQLRQPPHHSAPLRLPPTSSTTKQRARRRLSDFWSLLRRRSLPTSLRQRTYERPASGLGLPATPSRPSAPQRRLGSATLARPLRWSPLPAPKELNENDVSQPAQAPAMPSYRPPAASSSDSGPIALASAKPLAFMPDFPPPPAMVRAAKEHAARATLPSTNGAASPKKRSVALAALFAVGGVVVAVGGGLWLSSVLFRSPKPAEISAPAGQTALETASQTEVETAVASAPAVAPRARRLSKRTPRAGRPLLRLQLPRIRRTMHSSPSTANQLAR